MKVIIIDDDGATTTFEGSPGEYENWIGSTKLPDYEHVTKFVIPFTMPDVMYQVNKSIFGVRDK